MSTVYTNINLPSLVTLKTRHTPVTLEVDEGKDTVRTRMRLVCFVKWNNLNDCEIGSHSSHLCRSQGLAHVVQRGHFSSQTSPGPASLRGQAELSTCVTRLGTALPYQTLPFWTLCFSSKHFYYFSTFAEFPSLISGKSGEQCVCV